MAVFGGSSYHDCLRGYLRSLLWIHITISLSIFVVFGISAFGARHLNHSSVLAGALAGITIASPCVLFFALGRRAFYLQFAASRAATGAFLYSAVSLAGLFFIYRHQLLSPFSAFVLMGAAALGTGFYNLVRLRAALSADASQPPKIHVAWRRHWAYGRWALASCVANWIPAYIYYPLLGALASMTASGQLKALMNFTLPMEQIKAALSLLLLPYAANLQVRKGPSRTGALSTRMSLAAVALTGGYWAVILIFRQPVFRLLYSGKYSEVSHLLPVVAFGSIIWSACFGPAIALRAMESPASVFAAYGLATLVSLLMGIPLTWKFGLLGAIWGSNIADVLSWIMVAYVLRRKITSHTQAPTLVAAWKASKVLPEQL
jgi:O-antigen/teichoic acid export membrane protein